MTKWPWFPDGPGTLGGPSNLTARGMRMRQVAAWVQIVALLVAFVSLHDLVSYWWRLCLALPAYGAELCWLQAREKT